MSRGSNRTAQLGPFETLAVERAEDLLWVTLSDPDRANALSPVMLDELTGLYGTDLRSLGVRAVLLGGAGRNFSAGADLDHLRSLLDAGPQENLADSKRLRALFESVLRQEALTLAVVQGACVAGGCGLATAHDFVIAGRRSRFLYSEVRIGFVAALVATYLPLRMKGRDIREMLLNPEFMDAERALQTGLINRVADEADLPQVAESLAVEILERASSESIARTKRLLLAILGRPLDEAFAIAVEENAGSRATDDCKTGISTFLETKSPPQWR